MATSGVAWNVDTSVIIDAVKKHRGKLTHAARTLNVAYETLYKKIQKDPSLVQLVADCRNEYDKDILDTAEDVVYKVMTNLQADAQLALKGAIFALNSKGKERGWNNTLAANDTGVSIVDLENMKMEKDALKLKNDELMLKLAELEKGQCQSL